MDTFFYEIWFPVGNIDTGTVHDTMHAWIGDQRDRSALLLDNAKLVVQGFALAATSDEAFSMGLEAATDLYRTRLGQQHEFTHAMVRTPVEQLDFINHGLLPAYHLPPGFVHAQEFSAAAIMRADNTTDAQLFMTEPPGA